VITPAEDFRKTEVALNVKTSQTDDPPGRSARGVYGISATSELSGLGPQTLRLYERRGLLNPARTDGGTRRSSDDDITRLQRITDLTAAGVNLAGIAYILELEDHNTELKAENAQLDVDNTQLRSGSTERC
jgi:MerR family transcriptional regulator/heat shock protein HspR